MQLYEQHILASEDHASSPPWQDGAALSLFVHWANRKLNKRFQQENYESNTMDKINILFTVRQEKANKHKTMANETEPDGRYYSMGDTAGASDLIWMAAELGFAETEAENAPTRSTTASNENSDDTGSCSFGEIARPSLSVAQLMLPDTSITFSCEHGSISLSRTMDEEELLSLAKMNTSVSPRQSPRTPLGENDARARRHSLQTTTTTTTPVVHIPGPNERLYVQDYQRGIQNRIQEHKRRHPNDLPIYSQLSDAEKLKEQHRVLLLLQRLKIAACQDQPQELASTADVDAAADANSDEEKSMQPNNHSIETEGTEQNGSELLLTPPAVAAVAPHLHHNSSNNEAANSNNSFDSTQSVEQTRAAAYYGSPTSSPRRNTKRLATTSGKRGADVARLRLLCYHRDSDDEAFFNDEPSLLRSIGRLSLHDDGNVFAASQSPISQLLTHSPLRQQPMDEDASSSSSSSCFNQRNCNDNIPSPDVSFGRDDSSMEGCATDYNNNNNDTLVETSMLPDKMVRWDFDGRFVKEAPTDVRLAPGQVFRYDTLPVQRHDHRHTNHNKRISTAKSFPDPFSFYDDNTKLQRHLRRIYQWVLQRDQAVVAKENQHQQRQKNSQNLSACAVLSIEPGHIVDFVLKLALECPADEVNAGDVLLGKTLIVARTKEALEIFGQAFREGSAYSVFVHSSVPLKDRKSHTTSAKAAQFDIVLTTFDALKAPDSTITLNQQGHAIHRKDTCQNGWYTSKNCSSTSGNASQQRAVASVEKGSTFNDTVATMPTTNKQFSVLHRLLWRRVVFVDALGRKCFLAKSGTSRVAAATALAARSRYVRFALLISDFLFACLWRICNPAISRVESFPWHVLNCVV